MGDVLVTKMSLWGWQDGSLGKGTWESMLTEIWSLDPTRGGRRPRTPQNCPLLATLGPWHQCPPRVNAHTIIVKKKIEKS